MKKKIAAALLFTVALPLARAEQQTPPPPAAPREASVPQPAERMLANGLRVIVVRKKRLPLVAARLMIRTGAEADPSDHGGLADMTASLLTKGTTTRTAEQIAREVEGLGATMESGAGWDVSFVNLSALSSNFSEAMKYVADVARHPTFAQDEIDRLRDQNIDALQVALRQPRTLATFAAMRVIFGAAPYGHNLGGTPESLQPITRSDIAAFHQTHYRPDNALLLVAGDLDPASAFALAEKWFGSWQRPSSPLAETKGEPASTGGPRVVVIDMPEAGQAAVIAARRGIRRVDPSYNVAQVANSVLGGGYSSRLNQEIRIKRGLSYGAGSSFDMRREPGPFTASAQTKNESAAEVAAIMIDELNRMTSTSVAESELTPRKAVLIGNFARSLETNSGLVGRIAQLALYGLPLSEINRYISNVQSVTAEDVQKFATSNLAGNDVSIVIVGDSKKFLDALEKRFANVEVIPMSEIDLNSATLKKAVPR